MKKIRLLHVITRLPIGGAERLILGILNYLNRNQFESIICCIQDRGELAKEVESMGVPVISLELMNRGGYDRRVVPALRLLMRSKNIDLVHTHLYHANLYGRLATRKEKIPVISSVHNTYAKQKWHRNMINRFLARYTFCITAGSLDVEKDLIKIDHIAKNKIITISNSIDLERIKSNLSPSKAKELLGIDSTDIVVGTVGRTEEQKGHKYLLDAISNLKNTTDISNFKLLLVGDGTLLPSLKLLAKELGIYDLCIFTGNISELGDIYRAIDIFVMPSLWEGLSLSMLEAMAANIPMISTDVGGARDVLGDSKWGIIVNHGDPVEISTAIKKLIQNPNLRNKMAISGAKRVRSKYSIKIMTKRLETIYIDAIK